MIYKRCSRCGKRLPEGTKCPCLKERHREYKRYRTDDKEQSFYVSKPWIIKRDKIKVKFKDIDIYSFYVKGIIETPDTVHHIESIKDNWNRRLDDDNLVPLTESNHKYIHKLMDSNEIDKKEIQKLLFSLVKRFEEEFINQGV